MDFNDHDEFARKLRASMQTHSRQTAHIDGFHRAGVLVPIVWMGAAYEVLLTRRTETVETHKGQISFPGGMADAEDGDIVRTALRETEEELGITPDAIQVVGMLDDFATPSGFVITPVVGVIEALPILTPSTDEVAEVFSVPLAYFADPASGWSEMRQFRGASHEVWFYQRGPHTIWGATAMIIRLLLRNLSLV